MLKEKKETRKGEKLCNKHHLKKLFLMFKKENFNRLDLKSTTFNL